MRFDSHLEALLGAAVGVVNAVTPGFDGAHAMVVPDGTERADAIGRVLVSGGRPARVTPAEGAELASYADSVRAVFVASAAGETGAAARLVNDLLLRTGARPQLDRGPEGWGLHFHGSDDSVVIGWIAGISSALAICIGSDLAGVLGICAADPCDRSFVDTSKNGTRRFCSTRCQNRAKAAVHRSRRR
ncbi:MAG: CGNR zinc finger domain-containing protein [Nocardioides sp.]